MFTFSHIKNWKACESAPWANKVLQTLFLFSLAKEKAQRTECLTMKSLSGFTAGGRRHIVKHFLEKQQQQQLQQKERLLNHKGQSQWNGQIKCWRFFQPNAYAMEHQCGRQLEWDGLYRTPPLKFCWQRTQHKQSTELEVASGLPILRPYFANSLQNKIALGYKTHNSPHICFQIVSWLTALVVNSSRFPTSLRCRQMSICATSS